MPNDAKLGLIAGVAVVLLIAGLFFRREDNPVQAAGPVLVGAPPAPPVAPSVAPAAPNSDLPPLPPPPAADPEAP